MVFDDRRSEIRAKYALPKTGQMNYECQESQKEIDALYEELKGELGYSWSTISNIIEKMRSNEESRHNQLEEKIKTLGMYEPSTQ